jgi:hypothetical protein
MVIKKTAERKGRPSILVWAFGIQLLLGALLLTVYGIYHTQRSIEDDTMSYGFNNIC